MNSDKEPTLEFLGILLGEGYYNWHPYAYLLFYLA
jgi:hypothetical protein